MRRARYFSSLLARMQYSEDYIQQRADFCSFLRVFLRSLKLSFISLEFSNFQGRFANNSLRFSWQTISTFQGERKTQVISKLCSIFLSQIALRFFKIPYTMGMGAERNSQSSCVGMMLTMGKGYCKGLVSTLVKRQTVWVRILELSQMKTSLSYSMSNVQTSRKFSRVNILSTEQTHSRMQQVLPSSQSVMSVNFCWLTKRSQYSLLNATFLNYRSRQQWSNSSTSLSIWKRLSVCLMVSLMFYSLCLQMARRSILTMFIRFRKTYSQKLKKGQYDIMQKTLWVIPTYNSPTQPYYKERCESFSDKARISWPSLLIAGYSGSELDEEKGSIFPREILRRVGVGSIHVQSWMPMQIQYSRRAGLTCSSSSFGWKRSEKAYSGHQKLRTKLLRLVQQQDMSSIVFSLALLFKHFFTPIPDGKTNLAACISMSCFSFFEYSISPQRSPTLPSRATSCTFPSRSPKMAKFYTMPTCLRPQPLSLDIILGSMHSPLDGNFNIDIFSEKSLNSSMRLVSSLNSFFDKLLEQCAQYLVLLLPLVVEFMRLTLILSSSSCFSSSMRRSRYWKQSSLKFIMDSMRSAAYYSRVFIID